MSQSPSSSRPPERWWVIDALFTSLDARPPELESDQVDSKLCEKCRRDISREVGSFCPYCGTQRPLRLNLSLKDFVPLCSDCGYDLSGLADGKCPECNKGFELERLRIAWAVNQGSATKKYDRVKALYLISLVLCTFGACSSEGYVAFFLISALCVLIPWLHYKFCPNIAVQGGHILLLAMIPLAASALRISFNHIPLPGQATSLILAVCLAAFALWTAPLRSALVIGTAVSIPLFVIGAMYLVDGLTTHANNCEWTTLEGPVDSRWGALHAMHAIRGGAVLCGVAILLLLVAATYSRRILLQLRSRIRQAPPTARPIAQSPASLNS